MSTDSTTTPADLDAIEPDGTDLQGPQIATSDLPDDTDSTDGTEDTAEGTEDAAEGSKPDREAAKLRKRAQAAEAERDTLTEQVDLLRRQIIDGQVQATGARPEAFWAAGVDIGSMLTDEGAVDVTKVGAEIASITERFGLKTRLNSGNYVPREGANPRPPNFSDKFADAFRPQGA